MFNTSVVGSFPRPDYLKDAFKQYNEGLITKQELNPLINKSVENIIELEQNTGLDIISDGEQGRTSFVNFIGDKISGIVPTHITKLNPNALTILKEHNTFLPYVRAVPQAELPRNVDLLSDEYYRLVRFARRKFKLTLPSPYLLMWETWHNKLTSPYYKTPEDLGYAYVEIIRNEIINLQKLGLQVIQIDEPMLGNLIEANDKPDRYRKIFGIINGQSYRGFKEELRLCRDMMRETTRGINNITKEMHICHWPNSDSVNFGVGIERFIPDVFEMGINNIIIENKAIGSGDPVLLAKQYPNDLSIGLGVIDVRSHEVETPKSIMKHVEKIVKYIEPNRINLVPDCGFACGMLHKFPLDIAFKKITNMTYASNLLRFRYS